MLERGDAAPQERGEYGSSFMAKGKRASSTDHSPSPRERLRRSLTSSFPIESSGMLRTHGGRTVAFPLVNVVYTFSR